MAESLSSSMEDYLEVIYNLSKDGEGVRVKQIADRLSVSLPSVTSALKTLQEAGLVAHERYRAVELTESGLERADALVARHDALVRFLTEILRVEEGTAEKEACHMEHAIGATTLQRLINFLQSVQRCPRGNPAWLERLHSRWEGELCEEPCDPCVLVLEPPFEGIDACQHRRGRSRRHLTPLSDIAPGHGGTVMRVRGHGPCRRRLADMGISRGVPVEVEKVAPLGDPMDIVVRGYHLCLRKDEAEHILVDVEDR